MPDESRLPNDQQPLDLATDYLGESRHEIRHEREETDGGEAVDGTGADTDGGIGGVADGGMGDVTGGVTGGIGGGFIAAFDRHL